MSDTNDTQNEAVAENEQPTAEETTETPTKNEQTAEKETKDETASSSSFEEKLKKLNDTKDSTGDYDAKDIEDNKAMGILAYLSWLVLIPIFLAKDSGFARYHANQGLVLAIIETIAGVVFGLLSLIPYVGILFGVIAWLFEICCIVLFVLGIVNVANGKAKELPIIGKYKLLK